jgi:hypothetical protein
MVGTDAAVLPHPGGGGLGVSQDVVGEAEHQPVDPLLRGRAKVPEVALARDDGRRARKPSGQHAVQVAVEVEGVNERDPVSSDVPRELPDRPDERGRFQGAHSAAPGLEAGFFQPGAERPFRTQTRDANVPARRLEPAGDFRQLTLRPAHGQGVAQQENRQPSGRYHGVRY